MAHEKLATADAAHTSARCNVRDARVTRNWAPTYDGAAGCACRIVSRRGQRVARDCGPSCVNALARVFCAGRAHVCRNVPPTDGRGVVERYRTSLGGEAMYGLRAVCEVRAGRYLALAWGPVRARATRAAHAAHRVVALGRGREMEASAGLAQWANHACGSGANARLEIWEQADGLPCALLVATKKIRGRASVLVDYGCACGRGG
jgi:hypothetical protein